MSSVNPYTPPTAAVADPAIEIPEDIRRKIKGGWIAGLISGVITLGATLIAMSGTPVLGLDVWSLIDVVLIFGLVYGIYRKSRTCAVLMLVYFVASKIIVMMEAGKPTGIFMALIFGYYFWQGIVGTFAYHRIRRNPPASSAATG